MAATSALKAPLDRSLSKMMMRGDADEVDLYADYKLKQREHEFLKIQARHLRITHRPRTRVRTSVRDMPGASHLYGGQVAGLARGVSLP